MTSSNLVASHPGNANAERHGYWSRRLSPRARDVADAVMEAPWAQALDRAGAEELGKLISLTETLDERIERAPSTAQLKTLVDLRLRASSKLVTLLRLYGLVPAERANWTAKLTERSAWAELREELGVS